MGNLPVIHEVLTSFLSLGDAIVGDTEKARERWDTYANESIVGSYVAATVEAVKGNEEKSMEYLKGMGRATGKAVLGGGLLRDVPVLHEIAVCGESLGDMIGGGDDESARERWETYSESSVIGSGIGALAAKIDGDDETAKRLAEGFGKAGGKFCVAAFTVGATVATGGLAAPLGVPAAAASGAVVGGATGVFSTAAVQLIDDDDIDPGAIVGMGLFGAVSGAISGAETAKKASAAKTAAKRSENASKSSSCAKPKSTSSSKGNQPPDKSTPPVATRSKDASKISSSAKPKSTSSSKGNQPPDKSTPSSGTRSSKPKNNSVRPRSQSYSVYQEAEHFSPDNIKPGHEMSGKNNFSFNGGNAQRNGKFPDVWDPKDSRNMLDRKAASEAARHDIQSSVKDLGNSKRPGMITVSQDLESGSASSSASVRGNVQKGEFGRKMGWQQKKVLDSVKEAGPHGKGHGFCGEQVGYNNNLSYKNQSENLFQNRGKVTMQAYAQETKCVYTKPVEPCETCQRIPGQIYRRKSGP